MSSTLLDKTLGIIGGGQLGKMLLSECNKMNIKTHVLDPNEYSPCKKMTNKFYCGDFKDFDSVVNFGKDCDLITFEIEHINVDALEKLENLGKEVYPSSKTLRIIQDKNRQKSFFRDYDIPTANFKYFRNIEDLSKSIDNNKIKFPCVWKKTKFGYDGFGVKILKSAEDTISLPDTEMIIEDLIPFDKELSVIVARNPDGEIKCFKTVEMEFNVDSNQVEFAKALGLSKLRVFLYALVDARTPIITYIAILFAGLFGASAIIETVFAWNGIGGWAIDKILMLDIPAIQGFILFAGLITLFTYTFLDILITFIDPRIRKKTL